MPKSILNTVFEGAAPVDPGVINRAKEAEMAARGWPQELRDDALLRIMLNASDPKAQAALAALQMFEADLTHTINLNTFNAQLEAYRTATARLDRVRLSTGREAIYEDKPTEDPEVMESVLVSPAIEPLVAEDVEYPVLDPETGEQTGTVTEPDREVTARIENDETERDQAQAVIDGTPQEVIDYDAA